MIRNVGKWIINILHSHIGTYLLLVFKLITNKSFEHHCNLLAKKNI